MLPSPRLGAKFSRGVPDPEKVAPTNNFSEFASVLLLTPSTALNGNSSNPRGLRGPISYHPFLGHMQWPFLNSLWNHITSCKFPLIIKKGKKGQKSSSLLNDPCSLSNIHHRQIQGRGKLRCTA